MPLPLPGMRVVARFDTRFDADLAVARLVGYGIHAAVVNDPLVAMAAAYVTDPVFSVVVREEIAEDATEVLSEGRDEEADALDAAYHLHRFQDRPPWVRRTTVVLLTSLAGPFVVAAAYFFWQILTSVGP